MVKLTRCKVGCLDEVTRVGRDCLAQHRPDSFSSFTRNPPTHASTHTHINNSQQKTVSTKKLAKQKSDISGYFTFLSSFLSHVSSPLWKSCSPRPISFIRCWCALSGNPSNYQYCQNFLPAPAFGEDGHHDFWVFIRSWCQTQSFNVHFKDGREGVFSWRKYLNPWKRYRKQYWEGGGVIQSLINPSERTPSEMFPIPPQFFSIRLIFIVLFKASAQRVPYWIKKFPKLNWGGCENGNRTRTLIFLAYKYDKWQLVLILISLILVCIWFLWYIFVSINNEMW